MSDIVQEPYIVSSLERHLDDCGHTAVGQDIAAAILVIKDLHKRLSNTAKPVAWVYGDDLQKGEGCFGEVKGEVIMSQDGSWVNADTPLYSTFPAPSENPICYGVFNKHGDFQFACASKGDAENEASWEGDSIRPLYDSTQALRRAEIASAINAKIVEVNERKYGKNRAQWRMLTTGEIVDAIRALIPSEPHDAKGREKPRRGDPSIFDDAEGRN